MYGDRPVEAHRRQPLAELGVRTHQRQVTAPFAGCCGEGQDDSQAAVVQVRYLVQIEQDVFAGMAIEGPHHVTAQVGQGAEIDWTVEDDNGSVPDQIDSTRQLHGGDAS